MPAPLLSTYENSEWESLHKNKIAPPGIRINSCTIN